MMHESIENCETPSMENKKRYSATSLESMIDFAISSLETNDLKAISTRVLTKNGSSLRQRYSIISSEVLENIDSVVCHASSYPYALFLCHMIDNTKVYTVSLVGGME
ncbi:hypothetical protein ZOSMA_422G00020 [Zostera marina]|uniref:BURP domain-containing protein n=1 Tax=Zostera marina TaxID=29655 RepID=A0A0K9P4R4_ZOSMR|nr:hypothetical protein ZOSMA_422G00020 [Zostera marina]